MSSLKLHQLDSPKEIKSIVILLHGYGADGKDLLDLGRVWQKSLPNTLFVAPDAPQRCDGNPIGFQWYPLANVSPPKIVKGTNKASQIVFELIDSLSTKYNVKPDSIVLIGFSQGAMISLHTGLHYRQQLAGIVAYSGLLSINHKPENMQSPPVLLVHGEDDEVVPVGGSITAQKDLTEWGINSELIVRPGLGHGIDRVGVEEALERLVTWVK